MKRFAIVSSAIAIAVCGCVSPPRAAPFGAQYLEPAQSIAHATIVGSRSAWHSLSAYLLGVDHEVVANAGQNPQRPIRIPAGKHLLKISVRHRNFYWDFDDAVDVMPGRSYAVLFRTDATVLSVAGHFQVWIADAESGAVVTKVHESGWQDNFPQLDDESQPD